MRRIHVFYPQIECFFGPLSIPIQKFQRAVVEQFRTLKLPFFYVRNVDGKAVHDAVHEFR